MNKIISMKHRCFVFLFVMVLSIPAVITCAGDSVNSINLAELNTLLDRNKGKVVVVDLWATWCPPCRKEIPGFINLYNKYKGNVEIIGIAFDENGSEVVPSFIKKMGINYPVYLGGEDIAGAYNLRAYPTTLVYGKDGKVANTHIGYVSEKEFDDEISVLLKK